VFDVALLERRVASLKNGMKTRERLEILGDGGSHDDPELHAEPEREEKAPVQTRLHTGIGMRRRHPKRDCFTSA
jgi:hypothetical protein